MPKTKDSATVAENDADLTIGDLTIEPSFEDICLAKFNEANAHFDKTYFRPIGGGKQLEYITGLQSASRLSEVYGYTWEWTIGQPVVSGDTVLVTGTLSVYINGRHVTRDAAGGAKDRANDLGNAFKAAETTAFKRAAAKFGVGAYLYEKDDDSPQQNSYQPQTAYTPPSSQGNTVQFGVNNSTGDSTTGPIEAVSMPKVVDGKQKLGGMKVNGQWYNVSNRTPVNLAQFQRGQVVTIQHPAGGTFIDAITLGTGAAQEVEAF